jgi:hypothetical protein
VYRFNFGEGRGGGSGVGGWKLFSRGAVGVEVGCKPVSVSG